MTDDELFNTLQTAIQHGGIFYRKIAEAALVADPENKALILKNWPRLISHYGVNSTLYIGRR